MKLQKWRYAKVYLNFDELAQKPMLTVFVSPDKDAPDLGRTTPYSYITTRGEISYLIQSERILTRENAIIISGKLYDEEFGLAAINRRTKIKTVNR